MSRARIWTLGLLAAAGLVSGLVAVDIYLAWNAVRETRLARETAQMRTWEPTVITVRAGQLRLPGGRGPVLIATAQTRCSGAHLYYRLRVRKNPRCCAAPVGVDGGPPLATVLLDLASLEDLLSPIKRFNLHLVDRGGATIKTVAVARRRVYLQPDGGGGIGAGETRADIAWDCDIYSRVTRVVVEAEEFREES
jgi:hypothetical protein